MARMLYLRDSASLMQNAMRRHIRLCRKNPLGSSYAQAIQPFFNALQGKCKLLDDAGILREDAYDDIIVADYDLNNAVRDTFDTWKTYQRNHVLELKVNLIFPDSTFSDIIRLPYIDKPNTVDGIATKIESMGNTHELYPLAATLRTGTAAVRKTIELHGEAIRKEETAEAEVEIEKTNSVQAYEFNYLDARKQLGVTAAERLFPQIPPHEKDDTVVKPKNNKV